MRIKQECLIMKMREIRRIYYSFVFCCLQILLLSVIPFVLVDCLRIFFDFGPWMVIPGLMVAPLILLFSGSYLTVKWLIRTVKKSDQYYVIRKIAIRNIFTGNSGFWKFFQNKRLMSSPEFIESMHKLENAKVDDEPYVPEEFVIRFSKFKVLIIPFLLVLLVGHFFYHNAVILLPVIGIIVLATFLIFKRLFSNEKVLLCIDRSGITVKGAFISWEKIDIKSVTLIINFGSPFSYFSFDYFEGKTRISQKIMIYFADVNKWRFDSLLDLFLTRKIKPAISM